MRGPGRGVESEDRGAKASPLGKGRVRRGRADLKLRAVAAGARLSGVGPVEEGTV